MYLLGRSNEINLPPLLSSGHDWLLVLAWMAILFYLFLSLLDGSIPAGLFLLPGVLLLISSAYLVSDGPATAAVARGYDGHRDALRSWKILHSSLLVIGLVGVIIAFVLSMMYLVQHYRLKNKQTLQNGMALPSLPRLARWNWWATVIAVPTLTLGMLTGVRLKFLSQQEPNAVSWSDPIIVGSIVAWFVMMVFFCWLVWNPRPAGKQVAWLTICAFGFLLVTSVGLMVITGGHALSSNEPGRTDPRVGRCEYADRDHILVAERAANSLAERSRG
jgi:ABC-type uncharacterized transport system permease subunit